MELNLQGIDKLINPTNQDPVLNLSDLDLTGVDDILTKSSSISSDKIVFQPNETDWSLSRLSSIEDFFIKNFNKPLPISNIGQGKIHNKWSYDHKASIDIGVNPSSKEGKKLISYLKENNIPFLAFNKAISGVSTGPHIHVGRPSKKLKQENELNIEGIELDLTGLEEVLSSKNVQLESGTQELDITGVGNIQAPLDLTFTLDPNKVDFESGTREVPKVLEWATRYNKPVIAGKNPFQVGNLIQTEFVYDQKPDSATALNYLLASWKPEYEGLNEQFQSETGGLNILNVQNTEGFIEDLGNNNYRVKARPTRAAIALIEAYKNGGLREYNATQNLIYHQMQDFGREFNNQKELIKKYEKEHPYLSAIEAGIQGTVLSGTQLGTNVKYLGKALSVGNFYGFNSQEYLDLINKEQEIQEILTEFGGSIYNPPALTGKIITGAVQGATSFPLYVAAGRVTPSALPVMAYLENLHKGNRNAALSALPMAILVGSGRGLGQFTDINPVGSSAPFRFPTKIPGKFTKEDLSLFQETVLKGESVSIAQLTPFERQLIHRGANALSLQFPTEGQTWQDFAANIVVGLGFPVGKSPGKARFSLIINPIDNIPVDISANKPTETPPNVEIPIEINGKTSFIDLETANLNLLALKKSLKEHLYREEGDDLKTVLRKQQAIKNAIAILEKAIPEVSKEFFEKNEKVIRTAIETKPEEPEVPKVETLKDSSRKIFEGKAGDYNEGTSQDKAAQILKDFFKITKQGSLQSSLLPYADVIANKISDLSYLSAFYIEDFYRRGIVPTVDLVLNKIKGSIGDFGRYISDEQAKKMFDEGMKYYNSNIADPFFSKMKMDAAEKLPNRFTSQQARDILSGHKTEFEWTVGLDEFLKNNEGKKINKQDLIDIIQKGQVRVEESIAQEYSREQILNMNKRTDELRRQIVNLNEISNKSDEQISEQLRLEEQLELLQEERVDLSRNVPKYSLERYTSEKLELPGAKNSKEVKLISPPEMQNEAGVTFRQLQDMAIALFEEENPDYVRKHGSPPVDALYQRSYSRAAQFYGLRDTIFPKDVKLEDYDKPVRSRVEPLYKSAHWDEGNVVAHYRSNDRITTDNQRVYFGEEFQSDWNQEGRKHDYNRRLTTTEEKELNDLNNKRYNLTQPEIDRQIYLTNVRSKNIEPNPFMQHNWKELVLKRFLRDAAIAKDENGNYKYDGIGWTTARQQLERYGGILEGKEFHWQKNSDGTYSFTLFREGQDPITPHELDRITLERFAELTTKEAADFVRQQETKLRKDHIEDPDYIDRFGASGQFSLSQTVELRSKEGTYADYDVAYKNIVSKIGKRFGAKYSEKEINTPIDINQKESDKPTIFQGYGEKPFKVRDATDQTVYEAKTLEEANKYIEDNYDSLIHKKEKIHYLEITPSMRQSLEKEGLPLYGTGGLDPLKNPEIGIRNVLTTREAFNQHRENLVKSLEEVVPKLELSQEERIKYEQAILDANREDLDNMQLLIESKKETVFDSGLTPDEFIDQTKLLYDDVETFPEFSKTLIERFGERIKPFLEDLWKQVKGIAKAFHEDERGFFNLQLRRMQTDAEKKYRVSKKKTFYYDQYSIHRGIMLAQRDPMAGIVYDVLRTGQRDKNSFESHVLFDLRSANKAAKRGTEQAVADSILIGNETQRLFTDAELAAGDQATNRPPLNPDQIEAYRNAYKAEHRNLDKRLQHVLFGYRERADRLNNRLQNSTPGTSTYNNILTQLLDIGDAMNKVTIHYQHLKDTGYISLRRKGPIAAFVQDPAFPKGDKRGEVYRQFNTIKEAGIWVAEQEGLLNANPADSDIYDINVPQRLRAASARLTPAQFEDLIDSSGVNSRSPEIESLRDEIYSRFPSKGYELKRDYVRGYDRTWQFVLESISDQTEVYANSFYSRVAGEHAIKALEVTGLQQDKPDLYKVLQKYIDHEISSPERSKSSQFFTGVRKGVYLFQLGFDINQLYLNAIAQPISQTYSYFARVSHNGQMLGPFEAEKYWIQGWQLASSVAKKFVTGTGNVPIEFENIRNQLISEGVITPEFNKSLLEGEAEKGVTTKLSKKSILRNVEHWAGVFMRAGEKTTRTHAAAEAYLVGKNKFGLTGDDLVNFIVRSIDATQTNPSRAEAPLLIRGTQNQGEIRKLLYQFNAFNHMWLENLALNVKSDFQNRRISATSRHLIPLAIMGGIGGLPLSGIAAGLYTLITDKDPKDEFHKYVNNFPLLERLALYGVTGNATLSNKLTPTVPFTESVKVQDNVTDTLTETFSTSAIPAFSTAGQITRGFDDLLKGDHLRAAGGLIPIKPLRNVATAIRFKEEGIRTRKGTVILPKNKVTSSQVFFQGLGIPPSPQTEYYNKQAQKKRTQRVKKLRKIIL